jgi:hypothetical protein
MQVSLGYLVKEQDVDILVTLSFYWPPTCVNGVGRRTDDSVESNGENDGKRYDDQTAKAEAKPGVVAVSVLQAKVMALQRANTKILKQIFLEKELRGHSPNFCVLERFIFYVEIGTAAAQCPEKEYINGIFVAACTANEGLVRIQYKCLVPIYVFPEMKLCGLVISKTEL